MLDELVHDRETEGHLVLASRIIQIRHVIVVVVNGTDAVAAAPKTADAGDVGARRKVTEGARIDVVDLELLRPYRVGVTAGKERQGHPGTVQSHPPVYQ